MSVIHNYIKLSVNKLFDIHNKMIFDTFYYVCL